MSLSLDLSLTYSDGSILSSDPHGASRHRWMGGWRLRPGKLAQSGYLAYRHNLDPFNEQRLPLTGLEILRPMEIYPNALSSPRIGKQCIIR
jgi:hypothetical protein